MSGKMSAVSSVDAVSIENVSEERGGIVGSMKKLRTSVKKYGYD